MSDLISRSTLLEKLKKSRMCHAQTTREVNLLVRCENIVKEQPTVEAAPVVHGKWTNEYINRYGHPCHCCSVCGFHASHQDKNFCPECGADMRKGGAE